jgi:gliding motility-associated-like protein
MIAMRTKRKQSLQKMGTFLFLLAFSFGSFLFASSSGIERGFAVFEKVDELKKELNVGLNSSFDLTSKKVEKGKVNFPENLEFAAFRAAGEVNLLFGQGYIGTQGTNTNQANGILNLSTLGISRIGFSQDDADGDGLFGGTQGNDLAGTLKFYFSNGTTLVRTGAINWRETTGSKVEVMGFILDDGQADYPITYGSSQTFILRSGTTSNVSSTIGLKSIFSSFTFTDLENRSGNAATSNLLDALNAELGNAAQVSSIGLTSSSVIEGNNLVYTVTLSKATPAVQFFDFSTSGTGTSASDFNSTYSFSNGVVNNGDGTLTVPSGVSSFTVTVTTIDDTDIESTETVILTVGSKSGTGNILDNDFTPGITITPNNASGAVDGNGNLITTEAGASNTFSVVLDAQPTANVTVTITGLDATEGTLSTTTLTFTPANWNTPQTVTVTGADDPQIDGDIVYTLTATANGGGYTNQTDTVGVVNRDNDTPGITITPNNASGAVDGNGNLITTEAGASNTFSVVLDAQPTANVTVTITGLDATEGTLSTTTLTFTPANWNTPQTVTVTGADDPQIDGDIVYTLTATANGGGYTNQTDTVGVVNEDDDTPGITITPNNASGAVDGNGNLITTEAGASNTFSVVLDAQPTANVTVTITGLDATEGTLSTTTLTFTPANWNTPQTVTVTGADDPQIDGDIVYTLTATANGGGYTNQTDTIGVINLDNDNVGITVVGKSDVSEGSNAVFTVSLSATTGTAIEIALALGNGSDSAEPDDYSATYTAYYFVGATKNNLTITSGKVSLPAGVGSFFVSVPTTSDNVFEGAENFTLAATITGGSSDSDTATIKDDGSGKVYDEKGVVDPAATPDDDRALSVSSPTVNEGSPTVVFTVSGAPNQLVSLALANVTTGGLSGLQYSTDGGQTWNTYTSGTVALNGSGKMLVRTSLTPEQEAASDNGETLTLTATNTSGTPAVGTGTVKDDGTGTIFKADGTEDNTTVKDDDRPVTVSSPTVNEGSPTVVFTVSGAPNQLVSLALANVTTAGLSGLQYSTDGGQTWNTYTSGTVALNGSGKMLVRTSLTPEQEAASDNGETLTLTATNTSGTPAVGTGTVKDDGTGTIFKADGTEDNTTVKDDDRPLAVTSVTVNEGSPFVVFEVSGAAGQLTSLSLANVTTTGLTGLEYSTDGGQTWTAYTSGNVALNGSGKMLVRTSLTPEQEAVSDNGETLTLTATNTSGTPAVGTGTVKDDGTGTIFKADGTEDTTAPKDDDRALSVNSVVVNEIDPFAEFTVTGAPGQLVSLALADGTATAADYGSGLEYFNGTSWIPYTPGALVALDEEGKLKLRTPVKQDEILEGKETFTLIATNTGGTPAAGTATIVDYVTIAKDDFATVRGTSGGTISVSGNVLDNDLNTGGEDIELTAKLVTDPKDIPGILVFNEDGTYTFTPTPGFSGPVEVVYTVCGGDPFESCATATLFIDVQKLVTPQPDINATYLGIPLKGTVVTNDDVPAGSTYGTPVADEKNPSGAKISMNPDGSYTFEAITPGVYNFTIPVCAPDGSCVITTLSITVKERGEPSEPILKTDLGTVKQGGPIVINTLGNDAPGRVGVTLNPASVKITEQPKNGTVAVDPATGKITYTPNPGFVGKDVYTYTVCDTGNPVLCATAIQEITVVAKDAANLIYAADDFVTGPSGSTLSGGVIQNDADLEGNKLVVTPQKTETEQGTFTLNADGTFTFVPKPGFIGPVQLAYRVCTEGQEPICTTATLYLLVAPNDILAVMDNFQANEINGLLGGVAGNVLTNDLINGKPVKPTDVKITVVNNGGLTGVTIDANGNLNVPKGAAPGRYVVNYSICDAFDPTNCSEAMAIVEVFHGVNLRVFKSAVTPSKFEGDQMEFVIRVENNGNTDATAVVVTDRLDSGFSYLSSTVTGSTAATSVAGQEVKWTFASLPAGRSAEIKVVVKARPLTDGREKSISNTATVASPARELSPNDNSSTTSVTVKPFFLSNVITPNGDGKNDAFVINGLGKFASNELIIFNRYGDHVFQKKGYQNDWAGESLVAGTYFYILSVVDINGNPTEFKGWIQLIRE